MKEILQNPLILLILAGIGIVYGVMVYNTVAKNEKFARTLEKIAIGIFIFTIAGATGVTVMPFTKFNPMVIYGVDTKAITIIMQLGFWGALLIVLAPRIARSMKNIVQTIFIFISADPTLALLIVWMSISSVWSDTPMLSLRATIVYLETIFVAYYFAKQYTWEEIFEVWRWVNFCVLIWSLAKPNAATRADLAGCWSGILGHKNQFSFFMAQTAALWFVFGAYNPKKRLMAFFIALLALVGLQKGCSGASRILTVILIALWGSLSFLKKLPVQWAFVSVILFLVLSIGAGILVVDNLEAIVVGGLKKDLTITGRTLFWPQIIENINQRPISGYGLIGFWQPWRGVDNPAGDIIVAESGFIPPHSHNGFLDMACDLGWGGLLLFSISFFVNVFKGVVYLTRDKLPYAGLPLFFLTYALMTNLTETGLFGVTGVWFWYIVVSVRSGLDTMPKSS
jgi:exopolysaccharide production protein ExoQ